MVSQMNEMKEEVQKSHLLECSQSHDEFSNESSEMEGRLRTRRDVVRELQAQLKKAEKSVADLETELLALTTAMRRSQVDAHDRWTDFLTEFDKRSGELVDKIKGVVERVRCVDALICLTILFDN